MKLVAVQNLDVNNHEEKSTIEYSNSLGVVFSDGLLLPQYNVRIPIELRVIKKAFVVKKNIIIYNLVCFVICVAAGLSAFFVAVSLLEILFFSFVSVVALIGAFMIKKSKYRFVINLSTLDFIDISIGSNAKDDAKKIARIINKKVNKKV